MACGFIIYKVVFIGITYDSKLELFSLYIDSYFIIYIVCITKCFSVYSNVVDIFIVSILAIKNVY